MIKELAWMTFNTTVTEQRLSVGGRAGAGEAREFPIALTWAGFHPSHCLTAHCVHGRHRPDPGLALLSMVWTPQSTPGPDVTLLYS